MTRPASIWPASSAEADGPLAGLRVLDFSNWLPGPFCTQLFGDLGADVVKVEAPDGDPGRGGTGWVFDAANRNKRSLVADLKQAGDRAACLRLAAGADIVVEGFRPGVADRLGIGYDAIRAVRPDVVYCSISGYGQTGPWRHRAGHDLSFLAASGALHAAPHWRAAAPRRSPVAVADLSAAFYAAVAILAALRERDRNGQGAHLDIAIADAALAVASPRAGLDFAVKPEERHGVYPNNDLYRAADGQWITVAAVEPKFWEGLRGTLAAWAPALADARFDDEAGRRAHGDDLCDLLATAFAQRPAADWVALFEDRDVPVDRVVGVAEAVRSEQTRARGIVAACDGAELVVFPVLKDGDVLGRFHSRPPALGPRVGDWVAVES